MLPITSVVRTDGQTGPETLTHDITSMNQEQIILDLRRAAGDEHIEALIDHAMTEFPDIQLFLLLPDNFQLREPFDHLPVVYPADLNDPFHDRSARLIDGYLTDLRRGFK